jgi:hypothetical protein
MLGSIAVTVAALVVAALEVAPLTFQLVVEGSTRFDKASLVNAGGFASQLNEQSWLVKMRV